MYKRSVIKAEKNSVPDIVQEDIHRAVRILREGGGSEIYLFGSGAKGQMTETSDLDIAIRGCPPGRFFYLLGKLLWEMDHSVDLVNLDTEDAFGQYLQKEGGLIRIG